MRALTPPSMLNPNADISKRPCFGPDALRFGDGLFFRLFAHAGVSRRSRRHLRGKPVPRMDFVALRLPVASHRRSGSAVRRTPFCPL